MTDYTQALTDSLIKLAYPDSKPVLCLLSGSRAYSLNNKSSDYDMIGVHFMSTSQALEHPNWRTAPSVERKLFNDISMPLHPKPVLTEMAPGGTEGTVSLDSFEMWKFTTMWTKGSPVVYEALYVPSTFSDESTDLLFSTMRQGITNRIGRVSIGMVAHQWHKRKTDRKKTIHSYYRLLQALHFLRTHTLVMEAKTLWDSAHKNLIIIGSQILERYKDPNHRKTSLSQSEVDGASRELSGLVDELDKALITTKLPDQVPRQILDEVLNKVRKIRLSLI